MILVMWSCLWHFLYREKLYLISSKNNYSAVLDLPMVMTLAAAAFAISYLDLILFLELLRVDFEGRLPSSRALKQQDFAMRKK